MKKLIICISMMLAVSLVVNIYSYQKIQLYNDYYRGAEELLDTLENQYGWIDAIDNYNYYDATAKLHHSSLR